MVGALYFTAAVVTVLVLGTYLLQAAILALQVAIWLTALAARLAFGLAAAVFVGVWWLLDRPAAREALRRAQAQEARLRPAGSR